MNTAVVGGGIFGCTAAIQLARAGHRVSLFEERAGLLQSASGINQYRLHMGYHYPRSLTTRIECRDGNVSFREEYESAIIEGEPHFYAVALHGSRVTGERFLRECEVTGLPYRRVSSSHLIAPESVELVVQTPEPRFDPAGLRKLVEANLRAARVNVALSTPATYRLRKDFDQIVVAAYAGTNRVALELGIPSTRSYQYEVCEKPVVQMPEAFGRTSIVIMDGDFCSVDPLGRSRFHVLGHVEHAIHHRNVGRLPEVPGHLAGYLDRGICNPTSVTRFKSFIDAGSTFVPMLRYATHIGSMFTVRAVLQETALTDARPTQVEVLDDQVIRVFSGKIPTCVDAAREVVSILDKRGG